MSWWPWSSKPGEASISKSNLRDAKNRLRSILIRCGVEDEQSAEEAKSTGDPFQDRVNRFSSAIKQTRDEIVTRNEHSREGLGGAADIAGESQMINVEMVRLKNELSKLQGMLADSADKLRARESKEQDVEESMKSEKLQSLRRLHKERETSVHNCDTAYRALEVLDSQRNMDEEDAKRHSSDTGANVAKNFRTSIEKLKQRRRAAGFVDDGTSTDLSKNEETAEEMKALQEKKKEQDMLLGQLGNVLGEIHNNAKTIHSELEKQNKMIDKSTTTVDKLNARLEDLNKSLKGLLKEQKPLTCTIYVIACLLIISIVGYFVFEFGGVGV